jgi:hypoxanthine phosphoribosyltransferase
MKNIVLSFIFIIHWAIIAYLILYIYIRKNKKYDWIYYLTLILLIAYWQFFSESAEKNIVDTLNIIQNNLSYLPSIALDQTNPILYNITLLIISLFIQYNVIKLLFIYKVPLPIIVTLGVIFIIYTIYWRANHLLTHQLKKIKEMQPPEWLTESPYLYNIYKRKINKKISFIDILTKIRCYFLSGCNNTQIDWKMFENHCRILREKTQSDKYDFVVGIESGGAFVAKAIRKDCKYIKISKYDDNPNIIGELLVNGKLLVKTSDDMSELRNKNVLIVDDNILTGETLKTARNYILNVCGAKKADRAVLYSDKLNTDLNIEYTGMPFIMSSSPWGFSA